MVGGLLQDAPRLEVMRRQALALVDGCGARRIVETVAASLRGFALTPRNLG
jgi:hypothetical protein